MIYLDNAATTRIDDRVLEAMMPYLKENYGNPSTPYEIGIKSAIAIENARKQFAKAFSCEPNQIYFTGGGSEGDNWVLKSFAMKYYNPEQNQKAHIITSKVEHSAILETCKFLEKNGFADVTYVNVVEDCTVDFDEIEDSIDTRPTLVSIMAVNNEVGAIQPIHTIGDIVGKYNNAWFHTDATQYAGHILFSVENIGADFITCSAHKFYGPKGIGVIYIKNSNILPPFIHGGHQESGLRAGTENVAGIVGAGKAIEIAMKENYTDNINACNCIKYFINKLKEITDFKENCKYAYRVPTINISFNGISGSKMQMLLDRYGICVGTGSACNSGSSEPSYVLTAVGIDRKTALSSIRISFGRYNTIEEVDYLVECIDKILKEEKNE